MTDIDQPGAVAAASESESVGTVLKKARAAHDLSIEQVATELRIEAGQLLALEQDNFERIGVPVFVKGYLRQYGQRLGVDYRDLLALYYQQTKLQDVQIQPSRTIRLRDERQVTVWIVAGLVLVLVAVALAVWWLNGGTFAFPTAPAEAPITSTVPQTAPSAVARAVGAVSAAPTGVANAAPAATSVAPPAAVTEAAAAAERAGGEELFLPLDLTFEQDSWTEISDARGERLFFGLGAAGRRAQLRGEPPFSIVFGNADGVRMLVGGEPYSIPRSGRQGNIVRFTVDTAEE
jgi:cytoskeleton protein RodZ